jgi:HAMP domain-containing protein
MTTHTLRTRFILAGCLLAVAAAMCGIRIAFTLARLPAATYGETIDLIVASVALTSLALSAVVLFGLARAVLRPVRALARAVEAIRRDDLECRVPVHSTDELGCLAEGFNRMAETLADYRNSSLGELLIAKSTLEATLEALPDAVIVVDPATPVSSRQTPWHWRFFARPAVTGRRASQAWVWAPM